MNELNLINDENIIMQNGIVCMNAESIGRALGYSEPRKAVLKIYERNKDELDNYSTTVKLTTLDNKDRFQRVFT